jgi:replicative DNA helicase
MQPHDKNAEAAVLGGILLCNDAMSRIRLIVGEDDFYVPAHRAIYKAMVCLAERGQPIDIITLEHQLRAADELALVGGIEGIGKLTDRYGTPRGVVALAWRLRGLAAERAEMEAADAAVDEFEGTDDMKIVQIRPAGANYKALCPWHGERTPSLNVNPERQGFKCFGCGAWGSIFLLGRTFAIIIRRSA